MTDPTLAAALARARRDRALYDLPPALAEAPLADAYAVQDAYVAAVAGEAGGIAGYKLGANAPALLAHFGIDEPISGQLFGDEIHASGTALPRDAFHAVSIELELAATLGPQVAGITTPIDRNAAQALIADYRLAVRFLARPDLAEGVRAVLVDKDHAPRWQPARLADVDQHVGHADQVARLV